MKKIMLHDWIFKRLDGENWIALIILIVIKGSKKEPIENFTRPTAHHIFVYFHQRL